MWWIYLLPLTKTIGWNYLFFIHYYLLLEVRRMIKQNQTTLNTLHVIIDAVISFSACIASYYLMIIIFNMNMLIEYNYSVKAALIVLFGMAALQILCNFSCDLYRSYRSTGFAFEVLNILRSGIIVFTIMIILVIIMSRLYQYQIPLMFYFFANIS